MPFYAVARGKKTGVFSTWAECQEQTTGFKGPVFKKFNTEEEAKQFVQERGSLIIDKRPASIGNEAKSASKGSEAKSVNKSTATIKKNELTESVPDKFADGSLSPTLISMKNEMKLLQKQLSNLRDKFELYINSNPSYAESSLKRRASNEEELEEKTKKTKLTDSNKKNEDKSKFAVDPEGFLMVHTDGSCEFNGRHGARAGVGVYFGENHPMNVAEPVKGRATNNTAEIQAATYALELTKAAGFDKVIVHTDSQFMINCVTSWLPGWKKNDWKKKDGSEVINKEDLIKLDKATEGLLVKWVHVKGHNGDAGNESADKLAREGAKRYKAPE